MTNSSFITSVTDAAIDEYKLLYHYTCFDSAIEILTSRLLLASEPHVNFGITRKTGHTLATGNNVILKFKWLGSHAEAYYPLVGQSEPTGHGIPRPVIYHVYPNAEPHRTYANPRAKIDSFYWQSIAYPNEEPQQLRFMGHEILAKCHESLNRTLHDAVQGALGQEFVIRRK